MSFKAHLRNVAFEAALVLGLAAPALSQQVASLTDRQKSFAPLMGVNVTPSETVDDEAFSEMPSDALLQLAFNQWPLPGIDYDPALVRSVSLITDTQFNRTEKNFRAVTHIHGGFKNGTPTILTQDYLGEERKALGSILIDSFIMPIDTPMGANLGISIDAHEAAHALQDRRLALTSLLGFSDPFEDVGQSRMSGHGPALNALLKEGETPAETWLRYEHLVATRDNPAPDADDSSAAEYPLFYTEIRSYLLEAMVAPLAAHVWTRVPENRGELWAAFANIIQESPEGDNEVSRFLGTLDGQAATHDFPLILDGPAAQNAQDWLKKGYAAIKPAQRAGYFTKVLPEIYGELLEDLGDPQGMTKMGLPASPLHAFAFADHLIDPNHPWTEAEWNRQAQQVEPLAFERLCELAMVHRQPVALAALLRTEGIVPGHSLSDRTKSWLLLKAQEMVAWDPAGSEEALNAEKNVAALRVLSLPLAPSSLPKQSVAANGMSPSWAQDFARVKPRDKESPLQEGILRF